jgi:hypothetical protein
LHGNSADLHFFGVQEINMDKIQTITLLLSSAAIGALVSAGLTALSQWRERVARYRELLLTKSIEMAQKTTELLIAQSAPGSLFHPEIVTARWYHRQLASLFKTGKLDADLEKEFAEYINEPHSLLDKKYNQSSGK